MSTCYICFCSTDKIFTYDNNGSLTKTTFGAKATTYTHDYENRLTRVIAPAKGWSASGGSPPEGQGEAIYKYDYLGRRISKEVGSSKLEARRYIYDGDNIIAEYDEAGTLIAKHVYGPNIDEPIRMERLAPTRQICYYYFDGLGSVTDLSNTSGKQIEHYYYDPFGKTKIYDASGVKITDSAYGNYYRFTAREWDSETNLYYYRARMYDPKLGRFLQADPVGYKADINLYRYCGNNGINLVDPRGLEAGKWKSKTGSISYTFMRIFGLPTVYVSWNTPEGKFAELLAGLPPEVMEKLMQSMGNALPSDGALYSAVRSYSFDWREFLKRLSPWNWADPTPFPWQEIMDPETVKNFMDIANELGKKNQQSRDLVGDDIYPDAPKNPYK